MTAHRDDCRDGHNPDGSTSRDRPTLNELPLLPFLPSAITMPDSGSEIFAALVDSTIIQIGTTFPGYLEGGGLIIDYRRPGESKTERLVMAFSERGMWVER